MMGQQAGEKESEFWEEGMNEKEGRPGRNGRLAEFRLCQSGPSWLRGWDGRTCEALLATWLGLAERYV